MSSDNYLHTALQDERKPTGDEVDVILRRCPQLLDATDNADCTPLCYAARDGLTDVARVLIEKGANVNHSQARVDGKEPFGVDTVYWTPLHFAARNNHREICALLLDNGARVNAKDRTTGMTPLHLAVMFEHVGVVELLLERNANVDCTGTPMTGDEGVNPLHTAVKKGNIEIVNLLLNYNAAVDGNSNSSPLSFLNLASPNPFYLGAAILLSPLIIPALFLSGGWTPLAYAVLLGQVEIANLLVERGANMRCKTNRGWSLLHVAAHYGQLEMANFLFERGCADVTCKDNRGWTALHHAAQRGCVELGELLISHRSYVNEKANDGKTPIMVAKENKHPDFAQMLLSHGAVDRI